MMKADMLTLIGETPGAHGIFDPPFETTRKVYCTLKSIGQAEAYQARAVGLNPELKIILAHDFEYRGEKRCELRGIRYEILRTYVTEEDGIELTVQRVQGNAVEVPEEEPGPADPGTGTGGAPDEQSEPVDIDYDEVTGNG